MTEGIRILNLDNTFSSHVLRTLITVEANRKTECLHADKMSALRTLVEVSDP